MQMNALAPAKRTPVIRRPRLTRRVRRILAGYLFISPWIFGFLIFTAGAMLFSLGLTLFDTNPLCGPR